MQASAFLGTRMTSGLVASRPSSGTPCRQVTTCMAKKKGIRCIVTLECTEARKEGGTPSRYTTQKNRKNTSERLELKKYNKFLRRVTTLLIRRDQVHKEIK